MVRKNATTFENLNILSIALTDIIAKSGSNVLIILRTRPNFLISSLNLYVGVLFKSRLERH